MSARRIGIDVSRAVGQASGVGYYAKSLVHALARVDRVNRYLLYGAFPDCYPPDWRRAPVPDAPNFSLHQAGLSTAKVHALWAQADRRRDALFGEVDVVHSTAFAAPRLDRTPLIVTIHDLSQFVHPEYHTPENYAFVTRSVHAAARRADLIVTDSENSRREIRRFLHVPEEKVRVVLLAADPRFEAPVGLEAMARVRAAYDLPERFVLFVGSVEPRKNLVRCLQAFMVARNSTGEDFHFVLAGGSGWNNASVFATVEELGLKDRVHFTGYVKEEDLPVLYHLAEVFLYPSIYEGFGLPVLEAMACGTPVLTSTTSSLPEVAGNAAVTVDPLDAEQIASALMALVTSPDYRVELSRSGREQAARFSWDSAARTMVALYDEVARRGRGAKGSPDTRVPAAEGLIDPATVIAARSVEALCATADQFFDGLEDNPELVRKPFSNFLDAPKALCRLGLLLEGAKLAKGMTVLDFGAGSCWLSKILYEMGCETVSVDASARALAIGKKLFGPLAEGRGTQRPPQFLPFDGHTIDLPSGSVDRVLCFDAFHHVPNQREVLEELYRVLRAEGVAGFCEPGPRHSRSAPSQEDMRRFGVLENDIVLEEIGGLAKEVGFERLYLKGYFDPAPDLSAADYFGLAKGAPRGEVIRRHLVTMEDNTLFFLQKGQVLYDSRGPTGLHATLQTGPEPVLHAVVGLPAVVVVRAGNTGTATWLCAARNHQGTVLLGVDIVDEASGEVQADARRVRLRRDVKPGQDIVVPMPLLFEKPGRYRLKLDLVADQVCWFRDLGSKPCEVLVEVAPADEGPEDSGEQP